ncbi:MAG: tetratricopeptide repeat protein [Pseudomonadota bacterium]
MAESPDPLATALEHHRSGRLREAEVAYRQVLDVDPAHADALHLLGVIAHQVGNHQAAIEIIGQAIAIDARVAEYHHNFGLALEAGGRLDDAVAAWRRAVDIKPDYVEAHINLGVAHRARGQLEDALAHFSRAVALEPDRAECHLQLGDGLKDQGKLADAAACYRRALAIRPDFAEAHNNLANVRLAEGQTSEALAGFTRAAELKPTLAEAHTNLGDLLLAEGKTIEAVASFTRLASLKPDDLEAQVKLAGALAQAGHLQPAIEACLRALRLAPGSVAAQRILRVATSRQLPPWHLPMLADVARNQAFQRAIEKCVRPGDHVLDIGTGSGLLALMAARAGAARVTACEMLTPLAEAAREIVANNGYADRITILDKKSTLLKIGVDMPEPATVIVAEIFDNALLGEGVLPTLRHAVRHLAAPDARVIPAGATVYGVLVELPRLRLINPVGAIEGFDLGAFDRFRDPEMIVAVDLERESHRRITQEFPIVRFGFRTLPDHGWAWEIKVEAIADGEIDAVVLWFDLRLDDEMTIGTRPGGVLQHWHTVARFFEPGRRIAAGDTVRLKAGFDDRKFLFEFLDGSP